MTADDIRAQRFRPQFLLGLNTEEVSAFLEDVADAYEKSENSNWALLARLRALEAEVQTAARQAPAASSPDVLPARVRDESMSTFAPERQASTPNNMGLLRAAALQEVEAMLHDARAQAQAVIEDAKAREEAAVASVEATNADRHREADALVAEATARAESLIDAAKEEEASIRHEIERLSHVRLQLIDDVRSTLDAFHGWLETVDPRGRAPGRREASEGPHRDGEDAGSSDEHRASDELRAG